MCTTESDDTHVGFLDPNAGPLTIINDIENGVLI